MLDESIIEQITGGYVCPPDAGPAWRAAFQAGVDLSLIEESLRMTPNERLRDHQRALDLVLMLEGSRNRDDPGS